MTSKAIQGKKPPPEAVYTFKGNHAPVHSISFLLSPTEEKFLVGTREGKVHVWDFETRRQVDEFSTGSGSCIATLTVDEGRLVTHTRGEHVIIWNRRPEGTWLKTKTLPTKSLDFCAAQLVPVQSDMKIVYPSGDNNDEKGIFIACPKTGEHLYTVPVTKKEHGNVMAFSSTGNDSTLLILYETGYVSVQDLRFPKVYGDNIYAECEESFAAMCIAFDSQSRKGLIGSSEARLSAFHLTLENNFETLNFTPIKVPGISEIALRRDNKLVATAGWDSNVRIFSWGKSDNKAALKPLAVLDSHTGQQSLQTVAFSPAAVKSWECSNLLAAAGSSGTVCFWDIYN